MITLRLHLDILLDIINYDDFSSQNLKGEFVNCVILMQELVHYIIISAAPKKAGYHSDMRTFIKTRNYKDT